MKHCVALTRSLAAFALAVSCLLNAPAAYATPQGPTGDAFYVPPAPLPHGKHGDVVWSRPLTGSAALPSAATNTLVLYHTTTVNGADIAISGAIAIPKGTPPAGGWPIISWSHGTTGNAPSCTPTRMEFVDYEQAYLDAWVARGYAVLATDYEGQGTPGLHPYFVGVAAGRDTTDIVRAARELFPALGTRWFAFGHSEGGSAAVFTAQVGPQWAPELQLQGAVSFAPAAEIGSLLKTMPHMTEQSGLLPILLEMIEGIASVDPTIDLQKLLSPEAYARLPLIQQQCTEELSVDDTFTSLPPSKVFRAGADTTALMSDFKANEDDGVRTAVPLLVLQGDADEIVSPAVTSTLDYELCTNGVNVTYIEIAGKNHRTILADSIDATSAWVNAVAAGKPPAPNCS